MPKIKLRRGLEANLPALSEGEPGFTTDTKKLFMGGSSGNVELAKKSDVNGKANQSDLDITNANVAANTSSLAEISNQVGNTVRSMQTVYTSGNLTQIKELDSNTDVVTQTDVTYNGDGTVNTITEIIGGKQYITTLNYANGDLDPSNPYSRSVI